MPSNDELKAELKELKKTHKEIRYTGLNKRELQALVDKYSKGGGHTEKAPEAPVEAYSKVIDEDKAQRKAVRKENKKKGKGILRNVFKKALLEKLISKHVAEKRAKKLTPKTKEDYEKIYDDLSFQLKKIGDIRHYSRESHDEMEEKRDKLINEQDRIVKEYTDKMLNGREISKSEITPDVIKKLKVGDKVELSVGSNYMNDGGDSRDSAGYSFDTTILSKKGNVYEVTPRYRGDSTIKITLNSVGDWLNVVGGYFSVTEINGVERSNLYKGFDKYVYFEINARYQNQQHASKAKAHTEKKTSDWTKSTKGELENMIQEHFKKEGKRMSGLSTATKPRLIEIIKKYSIR